MDRLIGTGVALVTPFDEQQRIDRESLYRLVNYVIDGGVEFLVALGTTAETATLSADERAVVVHTILEANQGRLPVIAGIGGNNTAEVIRELQTATWLKACQGILSITPCYNKPTQRGLYEHFKAIAAAFVFIQCSGEEWGEYGSCDCSGFVTRLSQHYRCEGSFRPFRSGYGYSKIQTGRFRCFVR